MSALTLDTLKFAQNLRDKGKVPQEQAEAIAQAFSEMSTIYTGQLATKEDVKTATQAVETDLKGDIARLDNKIDRVEANLDAKIDKVELRLSGKINLLQWMIGFTLAFNMAILYILLKGQGI